MSLSDYLRNIPNDNLPAASHAMGESLYKRHLDLLRDATSPADVAEATTELYSIINDAKALLETNTLTGHTLNKVQRIADLNVATTIAALRFQAKHPIDNKRPWH